jgi:hypothetical protein
MKIHQQHLDQMALGYAVTAWLEANSPKKMGLAAKTLGVSARKASAAARYYRIHKNEPQIPELGPCDHDAVCRAGHTVKLATFRTMLLPGCGDDVSVPK